MKGKTRTRKCPGRRCSPDHHRPGPSIAGVLLVPPSLLAGASDATGPPLHVSGARGHRAVTLAVRGEQAGTADR